MSRKNKNVKNPLAGSANPELAVAMMEKRRSNAAVKHLDSRTKRVRTRQASRNRALADY